MIDIDEYIPYGYENRISRDTLQLTTGYTDREIRSAIEHSSLPIISADGGYFVVTESEQDLAQKRIYLLKERKRIRSILIKLKKFD